MERKHVSALERFRRWFLHTTVDRRRAVRLIAQAVIVSLALAGVVAYRTGRISPSLFSSGAAPTSLEAGDGPAPAEAGPGRSVNSKETSVFETDFYRDAVPKGKTEEPGRLRKAAEARRSGAEEPDLLDAP